MKDNIINTLLELDSDIVASSSICSIIQDSPMYQHNDTKQSKGTIRKIGTLESYTVSVDLSMSFNDSRVFNTSNELLVDFSDINLVDYV